MKKLGRRGAALVEYAALVSLIGVAAIFAVLSLGNKVSSTFEGVAVTVAETRSAEEEFGITAPTGPVTSWSMEFNEQDAENGRIPDFVTRLESNPSHWIVDLEPVLKWFPEGSVYYYDAALYQSGVRTVLENGSGAYSLRPLSFFNRSSGSRQGILGGMASVEGGTLDNSEGSTQRFIYDGETQDALMPTFVTDIELYHVSTCGFRTLCEDDPLQFSITIFTK